MVGNRQMKLGFLIVITLPYKTGMPCHLLQRILNPIINLQAKVVDTVYGRGIIIIFGEIS
jgi:hypothetical protein